jgi:hypothetical protein
LDYIMLLNTIGLLGLRVRYWAIIIVAVVVVLGVLYMARSGGTRRTY